MRKFIVSDLHGNGDIYDSIMGYLDNISDSEEVELFINGDLIDRGPDSFRMLMDVIDRINGAGNVRINYLGGNHELMMYNAIRKRKPGHNVNHFSSWMLNGGWPIEGELDAREDGEELYDYFRDFVGELKIYHVFDETIENRKILLVHAQAPKQAKNFENMQIKDNNIAVEKAVWTRREDTDLFTYGVKSIMDLNRIGLDPYFTIIGHTPVSNEDGFEYNKKEHYLNIDGGCAGYAIGRFEYNHVPLVEVKDNYLELLIFNHDNEIVKGYFFNGEFFKMKDLELDYRRLFLNQKYNGQEKVYKMKIRETLDS